jgi:hypothetical protein
MMLKRSLAGTTFVLLAAITSNAFAQNALAQNGGRDDAPPAPYQPPPPQPVYQPPPQPQYGQPYGQPQYAQPNYVTGPKKMPYSEGDPVPAGYHVSTHARTGLVVAGSIVFGIFYGFTAAGAGSSSDSDTNLLYVPVVGPILYGNTLTSDYRSVSRFFLWIDALAQAGGATMLLVGLLVPKTELVRNDIGEVHVQPMVGTNGGGLALSGSF